jgi:hypothetical protein
MHRRAVLVLLALIMLCCDILILVLALPFLYYPRISLLSEVAAFQDACFEKGDAMA